ncbi:MAG: polysaccharide biosynthesis protein [Lachnospiraceae bacterium]|nr:polysaccharide biosynthesis protein [Lachnospiraceae bacterium]
MIFSLMMASVGNRIATESREKNYKDMRLFDFIYTSVAGWATVCLLCLYQPFVRMWLGTDMMLEMPVVIALCSYFYILKSGDIRWVYQEGAGQWFECRFIMIGEAVANIVLNVLLCKLWGVFGIVLATVLSVFVTNVFFCPKVLFDRYFKNGKLKEYWTDHLLYLATMLLTAGCSWVVCDFLLPVSDSGLVSSLLCLAGRLVVCTAVSVAVFLLAWKHWGQTP